MPKKDLFLWEKPPRGWAKLNMDGASFGNPGLASCEGVVLDEHGNWISRFSKSNGITNSFVVELWVLGTGLFYAAI